MYVCVPHCATITLPPPCAGDGRAGCCLCKRVVIALARETQAETYRKDYTDPFASVAL